VLEVARREFMTAGYHGTTIAALAAKADVSPQTIYNTVGGKAALLKAVYDVLLAGDDEPVPMNDRPEIQRVMAQRSTAAALRAYAGVSRLICERVGPLLGVVLSEGAGADRELDAFVTRTDQERRIGNTGLVTHLAQRFGLPIGLSQQRAIDHVWTLTAPEVADRLIRRCGWSLDEYEQWLAHALVTGLRALPHDVSG
jgi:AcrR family transcriptional regulator